MIVQLLALFNPLSWLQKLASIAASLLIVFLLGWWFWSALGNHFTEKQDAEYARVEQVARAAKQQREAENEAKTKKAESEKIKQLEIIAADAVRLRAANKRLQNDLRAGATAETDLTACVQRARALDHVQQAVRGFAERVVTASDKHVADKVACTAQWPQ
jgi:hypothetical protein